MSGSLIFYLTCVVIVFVGLLLVCFTEIIKGEEFSISMSDLFMAIGCILIAPLTIFFVTWALIEHYWNRPIIAFKRKEKK